VQEGGVSQAAADARPLIAVADAAGQGDARSHAQTGVHSAHVHGHGIAAYVAGKDGILAEGLLHSVIGGPVAAAGTERRRSGGQNPCIRALCRQPLRPFHHPGNGISHCEKVQLSLARYRVLLSQYLQAGIGRPGQYLHLLFHHRLQLLYDHDPGYVLQHPAHHSARKGVCAQA